MPAMRQGQRKERQYHLPSEAEKEATRREYLQERSPRKNKRRARSCPSRRRQGARLSINAGVEDFDSGSDLSSSESFDGARNPGRRSRDWQRLQHDRVSAWLKAVPRLSDAAIEGGPENAAYLQARHTAQLQALRERIDSYKLDRQKSSCTEHARTEQVGERWITFCTAEFTAQVAIPVHSFSNGSSLEMPATAAWSFPSSAERPAVWFDLGLMQQFTQLYMMTGISVTGFCNSLEQSQQEIQTAKASCEELPPWSCSQFNNAWLQCLSLLKQKKKEVLAGSNREFYPGVFGYCPVCAELPCSGDSLQEEAITRQAEAVLHEACAILSETPKNSAAVAAAGTGSSNVGQSPPAAILPSIPSAAVPSQAPAREDRPPPPEASIQFSNDLVSSTCPMRPRRPLAITVDGNQKLNHYENCGRVLDRVHSATALRDKVLPGGAISLEHSRMSMKSKLAAYPCTTSSWSITIYPCTKEGEVGQAMQC